MSKGTKKSSKSSKLDSISAKTYKICGIYDFESNELISVGLNLEEIELEFDIGDYDQERYDIVEFTVMLV